MCCRVTTTYLCTHAISQNPHLLSDLTSQSRHVACYTLRSRHPGHSRCSPDYRAPKKIKIKNSSALRVLITYHETDTPTSKHSTAASSSSTTSIRNPSICAHQSNHCQVCDSREDGFLADLGWMDGFSFWIDLCSEAHHHAEEKMGIPWVVPFLVR
jgi:hypothetical protein